jgi:hypothetical protein
VLEMVVVAIAPSGCLVLRTPGDVADRRASLRHMSPNDPAGWASRAAAQRHSGAGCAKPSLLGCTPWTPASTVGVRSVGHCMHVEASRGVDTTGAEGGLYRETRSGAVPKYCSWGTG